MQVKKRKQAHFKRKCTRKFTFVDIFNYNIVFPLEIVPFHELFVVGSFAFCLLSIFEKVFFLYDDTTAIMLKCVAVVCLLCKTLNHMLHPNKCHLRCELKSFKFYERQKCLCHLQRFFLLFFSSTCQVLFI